MSKRRLSWPKPSNYFQFRALGLLVLTLLLVWSIIHTLSSSLESLQHAAWRSQRLHRIKKVSAVFGERNHLYESALDTHERHNRIHGYEMVVLRQRILDSYWSKPAYLLSQVVEELAKPADERHDWLMWVDPDTMVINPEIPLDIFLPPPELDDLKLIVTHDEAGFHSGIFFLKVDEWSVKLLIEMIAIPRGDPQMNLGVDKAQTAMKIIAESEPFRDQVMYQPRLWYNAYQRHNSFEGKPGSFMVHFQHLDGDRWLHMASWLEVLDKYRGSYQVALDDTTYEVEVTEYWGRVLLARTKLDNFYNSMTTDRPAVREAGYKLHFSLNYEADRDIFAESLKAFIEETSREDLD